MPAPSVTAYRDRGVPTTRDLMAMPAGERGPRLRALLAHHRAALDHADPRGQGQRRSLIADVIRTGRLAGVPGFEGPPVRAADVTAKGAGG